VLGIEPILSIHPASLRYKLDEKKYKEFFDLLETLRSDWRKVQAQLEAAAV
jgi:hypothetical protein